MLFAQRILTFLAVVFVLCLPLSAGAAVGRTPTAATVTPTGSSSYSIPIAVPPGVNGMTPSLALSYDSGSDNGIVGVGWSIAGLSAIFRCPRTFAQDGEAREVRLESSDRFCLDGNKLRLVTGTYGANGATYRTEIETFSKITSSGTAGNGPASFLVRLKEGLSHHYGETGDSRIEALGQTTPRAWALNKIRDLAGNYITFTYVEDATNGSFRISSIAYGGNEMQGTPPTHSVSFVYDAKPNNEIDSGYIAGSLVKEITRLARVDVLAGVPPANTTVLRRYALTYEGTLSSTSRSRVASVQECAGPPLDCLPATTFSYQNGSSGLGNVNTSIAMASAPSALDVDGDGRTDLVYSSSIGSGQGVWMVSLANASGGYNSPINTGVTNTNYQSAIPIDYNADGREDLLVRYSGNTWWVMLGSSSGLAAPVNTGAPVPASGAGDDARAIDVNGDGLEDLVWADIAVPHAWAGGDKISYRLRELGGTFSSTAVTLVGPTPANTFLGWPAFALDRGTSRRRTQDFNGDGRADIVYGHRSRTWNGSSWVETPGITVHCVGAGNINAESMDGAVPANGLFYGDFNGDDKTDLFFATTLPLLYSVRLSSGTTLAAGFNVPVPVGVSIVGVLDWDGDGYDDVLAVPIANTTELYVFRSTGESFTLLPPVAVGSLPVSGHKYKVMDVNGDGLPDLGYHVAGVPSGTWNYRLHAGVTPDLLQTAADGFGNVTTFNYSPLANHAGYTKHAAATFPSQDYTGSLPVVTSATASNGIGGSYTISYVYSGARINLQGRGFEGFFARTSRDSRSSLYTSEFFRQTFPYTGTLLELITYQPNATTMMSRVQNTWSAYTYGAGAESASLPFVSASTVTRYEVGGPNDGALISTTSTTNLVDSGSGTRYDTTSTTTEAGSANGVQPGATHTQRIYMNPANFWFNNNNNCIGRPGRIEYTNSHDRHGGTPITRSVYLDWDLDYCRIRRQVLEPESLQMRVTADFGYDPFGNVHSETVTGMGMAPRTSSAYYGPTGRFLQSATNELSQTTQFTWDAGVGALQSVTDPNGIEVSWGYDLFGRRKWEIAADGTNTSWVYADCAPSNCLTSNTKMMVTTSRFDASGSFVTDQKIYTDKFDRPIAVRTPTLFGASSRIDREYDALGRVYRQSAPYWTAVGTPYWTTFTYDLMGRVTQVQRPISDSNATLQSSLTHYEGLTTRSVDALGKQSTHVSNAVGQLARSIDHNGYYQSFDYDAFGNSVRIMDSGGNVLVSNVYNMRGMLTSQTDMDMGTWTYTPNALGKLISQTDAKGQTTSYGYDLLGRVTTRTEPEGVSTFTFGTNAAAHNIGQLVSMSGPGYSESYTYDGVGRLSQRTITSDATYQIDYAYNSFGLLDTLTYPASTSGYRLKLQHDYNFGQLERVRDFNAPSTAFWRANATDARGAVISEVLGNGILTVRGFDAVTGLLDYIQSGPGGSSTLQSASYTWDPAGNLTQRSEGTIAKTQNFVYDHLHRLDNWTTVGGSTVDLTYDALGNITASSSLGAYTYDATRKHRVLTAGSNTYAYDNNGNVTTKNGQPITWYSYDLPRRIASTGSNSSEFFYAPDRSRWKQVASYGGTAEATIYIGGLIEKVTRGGVTSWKHYIAGGNGAVAEVIRRSNGTNDTVYLLKDHLGSTEVITNSSGAQMSRLAYGAFGGRRNGTTWGGMPSSAELTTITNTTRRGFTSHEMLDNLGLVNMNGRIYDSDIGRFLSADPFVQAPGFTQSFNRYSYAWNNPLRYTDPSGFATADGPCRGIASASMPGFQHCTLPGPPPVPPPPPAINLPPLFPVTLNGHSGDTIDQQRPAVFRDNLAGRVLKDLDFGVGWATQAVWDGPARGLFSNRVPTAQQLSEAQTNLLLSVVPGARQVKAGAGVGTAIALGLEVSAKHQFGMLVRFAEKVDAHGWWDWYKMKLTDVDLEAHLPNPELFGRVFNEVAVKAGVIKFNLSLMILDGLAAKKVLWEKGNHTASELLTIVHNPALWEKVIFYREKKLVPKEQVLKEMGFPEQVLKEPGL